MAGVAAVAGLAVSLMLLESAAPLNQIKTQPIAIAKVLIPAQRIDQNPQPDATPIEEARLVEFFGLRSPAASVVYAIDCSGSMAMHDSLDVAKRELLQSVDRLSPQTQFGVLVYNLETTILTDADARPGLMDPTKANRASVKSQLAKIDPLGGTDHMTALRAALTMKPEVVYFLTDAELMTNTDVDEILREVGSSSIQAIEFGFGEAPGEKHPLTRLAAATGGSYVYTDVSRFPKRAKGVDEPPE